MQRFFLEEGSQGLITIRLSFLSMSFLLGGTSHSFTFDFLLLMLFVFGDPSVGDGLLVS